MNFESRTLGEEKKKKKMQERERGLM